MVSKFRDDRDLSMARRCAGVRSSLAAVATLALSLVGLPQMTLAQTQLSAGIVRGAISCAQSANATGHMVCAEYATTGALYGVSWQAPGTVGPPRLLGNHDVVEAFDTVSPAQVLGTAAGPLQGAPGCGPANNNTGTTVCLIVSKGSTGFIFQGAAFYPAAAVVTPVLVTLDTKPGAQSVSNASCASANSKGAVVCAIVVDNQLYGIGFEPRAGTNTHLLALLAGTTGFVGNPNCTSVEQSLTATCAIRQGGGMLGFALTFNPAAAGGPTVTAGGAIELGNRSFAGDPACAIRGSGPTSTICAFISGNNLLGVAFDPLTQAPPVGPQSLGSPPDGGSWTGGLGCSPVPDFRNAINPNGNLVNCAVVSSTANVFAVTFDPVAPIRSNINGPFARNINSAPSCIVLAVDQDEIDCGATRSDGTSAAWKQPVGLVPQPVASAAISVLLK